MNDYLTDDDVWRCVCAARLAELAQPRPTDGAWDDLARLLRLDPIYRSLSPVVAAERFVAVGPQQAAA